MYESYFYMTVIFVILFVGIFWFLYKHTKHVDYGLILQEREMEEQQSREERLSEYMESCENKTVFWHKGDPIPGGLFLNFNEYIDFEPYWQKEFDLYNREGDSDTDFLAQFRERERGVPELCPIHWIGSEDFIKSIDTTYPNIKRNDEYVFMTVYMKSLTEYNPYTHGQIYSPIEGARCLSTFADYESEQPTTLNNGDCIGFCSGGGRTAIAYGCNHSYAEVILYRKKDKGRVGCIGYRINDYDHLSLDYRIKHGLV